MTLPVKTGSPACETDLSTMMDALLTTVSADARRNKSVLINEIPPELNLRTDQRLVAEVLDGMLSSVVTHSPESSIRLSAKIVGHIVLVHMRKQGQLDSTAVTGDISRLHAKAEKILGSVSLNSERKDIVTMTFGFPNLPMVN